MKLTASATLGSCARNSSIAGKRRFCLHGIEQPFSRFTRRMFSVPEGGNSPLEARQFHNTHWSVVLTAGQDGSPHAEAALETLCRNYWHPLYFFVRRQGYAAADAQDLTQEFFAHFLRKRKLRFADPQRGRFRSFLLASLKNFLVNEWVREHAVKRGGGTTVLSMDEELAEQLYQSEAPSATAAENLYDKRWALLLLERAIGRLTAEYSGSGKDKLFNQLKPWLLAEASGSTYRKLAEELQMTEGAAKVALHRLRKRLREAVRDEVSQTVALPTDIDEELRCLMASLNE